MTRKRQHLRSDKVERDSTVHQSVAALLAWYSARSRQLPWREDPSFYRVWVSEIMLQQTQVAAVIPFFERFMKRFPDLQSLSSAPLESVLEVWAGLGYYSRARNLHRAAQQIQGPLEGRFPETRAGLEALPGIGPYTAGAILSIAGSQFEAIVDGNVERVLSRFHQLKRGDPKQSEVWKHSWIWVKGCQESGGPASALNQGLMELGALVCSPKNPKCGECPLSPNCAAFRNGSTHLFPEPKKRAKMVRIAEEVVCVFDLSGQVLLQQSGEGQWRAGLWDFPKLSELEDSIKFCVPIAQVSTQNVVTHHRIQRRTSVYQWTSPDRDLRSRAPGKWFKPNELPLAVGAGFKKSWRAVIQEVLEPQGLTDFGPAVSSLARKSGVKRTRSQPERERTS